MIDPATASPASFAAREIVDAQLRAENARLRAVLGSLTDCHLALDEFWRITEVNEPAERLLGHTRENLIGRNFWESFPQLVRTSAYELLQSAMQDKVVLHFEETIPELAEWVEIHVHPEEGGLWLYFHDRSAQRHAELELERFAALTRLNPNPVVEVDTTGRIIFANRAAHELAAAVSADSPAELLPIGISEALVECFASGESSTGLESIAGGRAFAWSLFPAAGGESAYVSGSEITDVLRLEKQLQQTQKNDAVGQLATGIAHDFNALLSVIGAAAGTILEGSDLPTPVQDAARQISTATLRAGLLTQQILTIGQQERMSSAPVDFAATLADSATLAAQLLGYSEIKIKIDTPGHPVPVEGDRTMLEQMIVNLVLNARDAMPLGGEVLLRLRAVDVEAAAAELHPDARAGRFARLEVRDQGVGMAPEVAARIFAPFFTTKAKEARTGLGLPVVLGVVKQHQGWITIQTKLGEGTTMSVFIPLLAVPEAEPASATAGRGERGGILLVEDNEGIRALLVRYLQARGYEVFSASSGDEALELWPQVSARVQVLVTDIVMPGEMNGPALSREVSRISPKVRSIYMSGYANDESMRGVALEPGRNFLAKPFAPADLHAIVQRAFAEG